MGKPKIAQEGEDLGPPLGEEGEALWGRTRTHGVERPTYPAECS